VRLQQILRASMLRISSFGLGRETTKGSESLRMKSSS
jgi:hypothetical protein